MGHPAFVNNVFKLASCASTLAPKLAPPKPKLF